MLGLIRREIEFNLCLGNKKGFIFHISYKTSFFLHQQANKPSTQTHPPFSPSLVQPLHNRIQTPSSSPIYHTPLSLTLCTRRHRRRNPSFLGTLSLLPFPSSHVSTDGPVTTLTVHALSLSASLRVEATSASGLSTIALSRITRGRERERASLFSAATGGLAVYCRQ